ncbi:TolC family protein [Cytophagaceae bacterium DM2B3-1]|uniref:TolC family protein n=1 Tax=Xanthocytophaga flava TaxID=3048013 RepID=A0ABT7CM38_9BACT|nr:TolC family protein [Xanthocytophaga flavus]MDJ1494060.1 TolC family protein [Xanthocytophaga flavus]
MVRLWFLLVSSFVCLAGQAQQTITLEQCYTSARETYPLVSQKTLQEQIGHLNVKNIQTNRYLPQLAINGQASWQNEVTQLPIHIPNIEITPLSKDQYKLTLDANYILFDGSTASAQTQLQRASIVVEQQKIEVELNKLKDQVNVYYLNALLLDENIALTKVLQEDLKARMDKLSAGVKYGTSIQSNVDVLQAEYLKADQRLIEMEASRKGFRDMLALLTGLSIDQNTTLLIPQTAIVSQEIKRPENQLFNYQKTIFDSQTRLINSKSTPRISAFVQTGFGRPALNFLSNEFKGLFIGGIRLNWNLSNLYTMKNEKSVLRLNQQLIDSQKGVFDKNLTIQLRQQQTEIDKLRGLITKDNELVALRIRIKTTSAAQLENGVTTASDYVNDLNAENQAKLNQKIHEFQLLMAQITYRTVTGN